MSEQKKYHIGDAKTTPSAPGRGRGPAARMHAGEKAKDFKKSIRQLLKYCRQYIPVILAAAVLSIFGAFLNLAGPGKFSEMTKQISDGFMSGIDVGAVTAIAAALAALYAFGYLFSTLQGLIMASVTLKISRSLRGDISRKINRLPLKYFDGTSIGNILSCITNDVDTIAQAFNQSLGLLAASAAMLLGSVIMMFYTNWILAVSGILATLGGFAFMMLLIARSQKYFSIQQEQLGALNGHIEETYAGHTIIKAYNGEKDAKAAFYGMNGKLYESAWKSQFMSGLMMPLMGFVGNFGYVVVCAVGAVLTMNGIIGFETIVAFMLYIRLFGQPLTQIAQAAASLQSAAAASERVFAFLDEPEMEDESEKTSVPAAVNGDVEFRHVCFGYSDDRIIIKDFSANVKAGQKIAIVGPTGAGKTTMVNLLMRFYEIQSGEILIDGIPTSRLSRENIHSLFCMVLQDAWLFEGTIRENIIYAKTDASEEKVIAACKAAGLHRWIESLPQGYDTVLNENATLSAGQRQLLTIARAMVEDAPMLILDEATSSVDTRTEILIQNAMDKLMAGRTSFVIAHRLSTIKNADLILVMRDGNIAESGTHADLLAKEGFYAQLYNSQFETG